VHYLRKRCQVTSIPQGQILATRTMVLVEEVEAAEEDGKGKEIVGTRR
jgi:hypothetical protein